MQNDTFNITKIDKAYRDIFEFNKIRFVIYTCSEFGMQNRLAVVNFVMSNISSLLQA